MNLKNTKLIILVLVMSFGVGVLYALFTQEGEQPSSTSTLPAQEEVNTAPMAPAIPDIRLNLEEALDRIDFSVLSTKRPESGIKKAKPGNASAQFNLGLMYYKEGVRKNYAEAVKWFRKSAGQGYPVAQYFLGVMYESGLMGVKKDSALAVQWFRKAAKQGDAYAQSLLGWMYEVGEGVQQDYATALKWYRKAAEQWFPPAQYNLGLMYYDGLGVKKDSAAAVEWYRRAAEQGYAYAQYNLGNMYDRGEGVQENTALAVKWWLKAADVKEADAMFNLGVAYSTGRGVPHNSSTAVDWYYKAGLAYLRQGQKQDARTALNRIENTVPSHLLAEKLTTKIDGDK